MIPPSNTSVPPVAPVPPPAPVTPVPPPVPEPTPVEAPGATQQNMVPADPTAPPPSDDKPAAKKNKPIALKSEFVESDTNKDHKHSRSELKLTKAEFKDYDQDKDGDINLEEYRAGQRKANSFKGLDTDGDKKLSADEMGKLRRYTTEEENAFDADGDGSVSRDEFLKGRATDRNENRSAIRDQEFKKLTKEDKEELKRYDTDDDGKIALDEYHAGRKQDWRDGREKKIDHLFKEAGGKDDTLDVTKAKEYKSYDKDGDGKITKEEFKAGHMADRKSFWENHWAEGEIPKDLIKRLGLTELGFGLNHIPKPPADPAESKDSATPSDEFTIKTEKGLMVRRPGGMIAQRIAEKFDKMVAAAEQDGISLEINSGFRTFAEQQALYAQYGPGRAAPPGQSNHEDGNAIDFTNNAGAYDWLAKNASGFGLHNLPGEPWHYSIDGH